MSTLQTEIESDSVERQITSGTKLVLRGTSERLNSSLFAINWFDTKPAWVYHLYNLLASTRLKRIGGRAVFKGRVFKKLAGEDSLARQHLLIVNYPSANHFLNLVADKLFLMLSILRIVSVRNFSFVMQHRVDDGLEIARDQNSFAVLHFASDDPACVARLLENDAETFGLQLAFFGKQAVTVSNQRRNEEQTMPFVTPNTVLLAGEQESQLADFFASPTFQEAMLPVGTYYAAALRRTV